MKTLALAVVSVTAALACTGCGGGSAAVATTSATCHIGGEVDADVTLAQSPSGLSVSYAGKALPETGEVLYLVSVDNKLGDEVQLGVRLSGGKEDGTYVFDPGQDEIKDVATPATVSATSITASYPHARLSSLKDHGGVKTWAASVMVGQNEVTCDGGDAQGSRRF
ncbi:hypothetical protein [Nocardioides sp.]|uniref:hypothetical protein n=1 Tax=Nocardioides sp. TaxID=35761 RepID=UPI00260B83A0|nr:hypothetical protein [Nocardioides sp.]